MLFKLLAKAGLAIDDHRAGPGGTPLQVAALPFRAGGDEGAEVLLITSRSTGRWILPKGWPVRGLSLAESAAREAYEEAGVRGTVEPRELARLAFHRDARSRKLAIFPLRVDRMLERWPERGERKRRWMTPDEAVSAVSVAEIAAVLRDFADRGFGEMKSLEGRSG